jgi:hypothetical protein
MLIMKVTIAENLAGKISHIKMIDSLNAQLLAMDGTCNNAVLQFESWNITNNSNIFKPLLSFG